jgi:hypothetical protein
VAFVIWVQPVGCCFLIGGRVTARQDLEDLCPHAEPLEHPFSIGSRQAGQRDLQARKLRFRQAVRSLDLVLNPLKIASRSLLLEPVAKTTASALGFMG